MLSPKVIAAPRIFLETGVVFEAVRSPDPGNFLLAKAGRESKAFNGSNSYRINLLAKGWKENGVDIVLNIRQSKDN